MKINKERINKRIKQLSEIHEVNTKFTRRSFTPEYKKGRKYIENEMKQIGLEVRYDSAGNLIGLLRGSEYPDNKIMTGSHTDTVMDGGRFDGIVGVIAGLEIAQLLKENNIQLRHSLEVVDFLAEEASIFGIGTIGSRGKVGNLSAEDLSLEDPKGYSLAEAIKDFGGNPQKLNKPLINSDELKAFFELHIEQGPILESENKEIGIVTGIVGITRCKVSIYGNQDHAGTTPMSKRKDALVIANKVLTSFSNLVSETNRDNEVLVGTVGVFNVFPNYPNVIPGRVEFEFELRSLNTELIADIIQKLNKIIEVIMKNEGGDIHITKTSESDSVLCSENLMNIIGEASNELGFTSKRIPSGAGHDTAQLSKVSPVSMIFIPCEKGVSHHPSEFVDISSIAKGVELLYESILKLDKK